MIHKLKKNIIQNNTYYLNLFYNKSKSNYKECSSTTSKEQVLGIAKTKRYLCS